MARLPRFVEQRIRQIPPEGLGVVSGSTPVVSLGDFRKASVATLGWNPSKNEFLDRCGEELCGDERRFETHASIGAAMLKHRSRHAAKVVFDGCCGYFKRNPYHWFIKLERVLNCVGASYFDGTACHLDLVQWSTDPVWRGLSELQQARLLESDLPFPTKQLSRSSIRLLLLNGTGIIDAYGNHLGKTLNRLKKPKNGRICFHMGVAANGMKVIGWNINLQSSRGVKNAEIKWIGTAVKRLIQKR